MSKSESSSRTSSPSEKMANSTTTETVLGDKESSEQNKDNSVHQENESRNKCKTSFSVDDILSPSKFNGQMSTLTPEYFMRWQPWLMQEALRQNCPFPDLALSFYKPFFMSQKDG